MSIFIKSFEENILPYRDITTKILPEIGKQYNKDWHNIERGIRTAIKKSNFKGTEVGIVLTELYTQIKDLIYTNSSIEQVVISVLKDNSFSKIHLEGYKYLKYILINAISTHTRPYRDMKTIVYPSTAKNFNVTEKAIETCVYSAIKKSALYNMTVSEAINKLYEDILIKINK